MLSLMGSILTSMVCFQMCAGSPSTVEVSIPRVVGGSCGGRLGGVQAHKSHCVVFLLSSSDEGPVQVILQGGREHGLLSAPGQSGGRDSVWPGHQRYLRPRPLPGKSQMLLLSLCCPVAMLWFVAFLME